MQDKVQAADGGKSAATALPATMETAAGGAVINTAENRVTAGVDSHAHQTAAELVAAAAAAAAEQAEALLALKKLSKEEALRMFETQNPARRDSATEQIVEHGIELQSTHGTKFAAAYLEEHKVPLDVGRRVLLTPLKRRTVRPKR